MKYRFRKLAKRALVILLRATYLERMIITTFTAQATKCAFDEALPRDSHLRFITNVFICMNGNYNLYFQINILQ